MHGSLESIPLNADFSAPLQGYFCQKCHGVWLRSMECRAYLGLECDKLIEKAVAASVDLECPLCGSACKVVVLELESLHPIEIHICPRCFGCFFDATEFALIFSLQLKSERDVSGILDKTPLDNLGVVCCDCGAVVNQLTDLHDVGIGYCCQNCFQTPPILSENKLQNVQLVTFHGMEIKIDHWQQSTRSRISVTPVEPCLLDVRMYSLTWVERLMKMGRRHLRLHNVLGRQMDATEDISHVTPWHVFLKQRGITESIRALNQLGSVSLTFKPHSIIIELTAKRAGTETRTKFEAIVRRLLIGYERFVKLAQEYEMPQDDITEEEKKSEQDENELTEMDKEQN